SLEGIDETGQKSVDVVDVRCANGIEPLRGRVEHLEKGVNGRFRWCGKRPEKRGGWILRDDDFGRRAPTECRVRLDVLRRSCSRSGNRRERCPHAEAATAVTTEMESFLRNTERDDAICAERT